jgi:dihydroorotate dehydrogenase
MEGQLQQYGWIGIAVYFFFRDVWPWLRKRLDKSQDSDANIAEAKLTREAAREERMVRAMEDMAKTSRAIECILSSVNVRLDVIERRLGLDAATK